MLRIHNQKKPRSYMEVGSEIYSDRTDRFVTARHLVREIFVDETLLKIDGQDYWLWIAYEPNLNTV
jgi:transposase-like protein